MKSITAKCGIYCIENRINHRKYVGQSIDLYRRIREHEIAFRKDVLRPDKENIQLWKDVRLWGRDNFDFYIITYCQEDELDSLEQAYIIKLNAHRTLGGYNAIWGGEIPTRRGIKLSQSHIQNIRNSKMGDKNPFFGKRHSKESMKRKSEHQSGNLNHLFGKKVEGCSSDYFGVHFVNVKVRNKIYGYWEAALGKLSKKIYLGRFVLEIDAARAYDKYVIDNNLPNPLNFRR